MTADQIEEMIAEALDITDRIARKPDVPKDQILHVMNRLSAISTRLRFQAAVSERNDAKRFESLARGLDSLVSTLKYQCKAYFSETWGGE